MSNKKRILIITASVVVLAVAAFSVWWFFVREREGLHDEKFPNPDASQIASFEGCLVHSADQYNAGKKHLTSWFIVEKPDGAFVRRHVETTQDWDRLHKKGSTRVIQLPEPFMGKYLPVEAGVPA